MQDRLEFTARYAGALELCNTGDFRKGARVANNLIRMDPNNPRGHELLGAVLAGSAHDIAAAIPSYLKAMELCSTLRAVKCIVSVVDRIS